MKELNREAMQLALAITTATVNRDEEAMNVLRADIGEFIGLEMPEGAPQIFRVVILATAIAAFTNSSFTLTTAMTGIPQSKLMELVATSQMTTWDEGGIPPAPPEVTD